MEIEEYETFRTFNSQSKDDALEKLQTTYDFKLTDSEGVLQHGAGNAYAEVTESTIAIQYDTDVLPNDDTVYLWDRSIQMAMIELNEHGTSFYDLDGMLEIDESPAEEMMDQWDVEYDE